MDYNAYQKYISAETMMGPNSVRVLEELLDRYPLRLTFGDPLLDLGCGTGLTSLVIARETGAKVYANDLWVSAEENGKRFAAWGAAGRIIPVCEDANDLPFNEKQFCAVMSVDAYHYFAGQQGFFQEKIMPFIQDKGVVLIGVPGLKKEYTGRAKELLSDWLGDEADLFKSAKQWEEIIGAHRRIDRVEIWEMDCFDRAWKDWLASDHEFARGDERYFASVIEPYTAFVGIYIKLK